MDALRQDRFLSQAIGIGCWLLVAVPSYSHALDFPPTPNYSYPAGRDLLTGSVERRQENTLDPVPDPQAAQPPGEVSPAAQIERGPGRIKSALRYSFADGLLTTVMASLVDPFAIPALLAMGAGNMTVAILTGTGMLLSGLSQLFSPVLVAGAPSRKALVMRCVRAQALACMFLGVAGFLGGWGIPLAIAAYAIYGIANSMAIGPWASWMSDLLPRTGRGRYFALRGMIYSPIGGAVMLGTGVVFRMLWGGQAHAPWLAFAAIFALAGLLRLGASLCLGRQHEPPARGEKTPAEDFTYWQFLRKTPESNFARFTVLFALLNGGAFLTGPFFATYVMNDLHCGYLQYTLFQMCAIVTSMIFVRFWARVADRWGNMLVIRVTAVLLSLIPLLYVVDGRAHAWSLDVGWLTGRGTVLEFASWPLYLGWLGGGAVWSGLNLASFNFVMETATPRRRVRCYSYMQATVGVVVAAFMFGWGAIVEHLPVLFQYRLQTVFLCSMFLRMLPALGLIFLVKERVERPEAGALDLFFELPAVRPAAEFLRALAKPFMMRG